jgi:hypothetical protein
MTKASWLYVVHAGRASTERASAADEVRALYGRPDAEPLPADAPDPAERRRKLSFHGLLHRPSGTSPSRP